ncbi:MAG TPA: FtsW/RodA/SpoVE family cell cycle protein [Candidatus Limnocylindria bacterium]|nr:FtsW/RodA/SpoVE family cell cycle protein [Candidatus Limnocylindria bacterium]
MAVVARALHTVGIRPRFRWRETALLSIVGLTLLAGWASLQSHREGELTLGDLTLPGVYLGTLAAVHVAFVMTGRRMDQLLFPAAALLGGLSLLLMERLPQDLAAQSFFGRLLPLAPLQLLWMVLGFCVLGTLAIVVRNDGWLRRYKYSWAALGIFLLLLVFVFGDSVGGSRLTLRIGPLAGQPSELLKVILVVFLAGYLAENRALLSVASTRLGPIRLPPLPYLAPMMVMWGLALAIVIVQRDLGAALLFFLVFLALLYVATQRASYVIIGLALFAAGALAVYELFPHVRVRVDVWLDPFADPLGAGYQVIRALYAFGRGGILGTGLGAGLPQVGGTPSIPAIHTDFVFAALAEELGLLGGLAILAVYALIAQRGLRIAARAADDYRALLAIGLTLVIVVQAAIIIGGNLRLVPLTGITLPLVSYGGSSLIVNSIVIGLLLALSDRGVEPPPLPGQRAGRVERLRRRARRVGGKLEEAVS